MASPPTAWEPSVTARPILKNPSSPLAAENHRVAIVNTSMAGRPAYSHHKIKPEIVMKRFMKLALPIIVGLILAANVSRPAHAQFAGEGGFEQIEQFAQCWK